MFRVGLLSRGYGNVSAEQPTAGESELQRIHDGVQTRPDVIHKFDAAQPTLTFGPLLAGENENAAVRLNCFYNILATFLASLQCTCPRRSEELG